MCESKHEECDEARGARHLGRQSQRPGAIGMPWFVSATDNVKLLILNDLNATRFWRQPRMDAFRVTHLCPELQIRAGEWPQRTRENCVGRGSHRRLSVTCRTAASVALARTGPAILHPVIANIRSHVATTVLSRPSTHTRLVLRQTAGHS